MKRLVKAVIFAAAIPALAACATATGGPQAQSGNYPESAPYNADADAKTDVELAFIEAVETGKHVIAIFGANWCHDSRALAGWLETPRFAALTDQHFIVVHVDAGVPQSGNGRNLDIAEILGVADITGTPSLLVLSSSGELLNTPDEARSWRNAASRSEDAIFARLESFVQ